MPIYMANKDKSIDNMYNSQNCHNMEYPKLKRYVS